MKQITLTSREYSVAAQDNPTLDQIRDRIKNRYKNYRIETGRDLIKAKALLPHGEFKSWLEVNFKWSESTAQNYMNAARIVDKNPELAKLPPSAVAAIAAPGTPEAVKSEVIAAVAAGEVPTAKEIKAKTAEVKAAKPAARKEAAGATAATLPTKEASDGAKPAAETDGLVERLRTAGIDTARIAFEAAFPGYVVTALDELEPEIAKQVSAELAKAA